MRRDALSALIYLKVVWQLDYRAVQIHYSGRKGVHLTIKPEILGVYPAPNLNEVYRSLARDIQTATGGTTLDMKIYDRRRLFRVPNSIHQETRRYKIPLTAEELARLSEQEIAALASGPRRLPLPPLDGDYSAAQALFAQYVPHEVDGPSQHRPPVQLDFDPPCVAQLVRDGAEAGRRNLSCAALANHLQRRGNSEAEAIEKLLAWNEQCRPPLAESEVRQTVRSIYRGRYSYGCTTFREISACSDHCPISLHRRS